MRSPRGNNKKGDNGPDRQVNINRMKCDTIPDIERFLTIQEQALGQNSPEVAHTVSKLAGLYFSQGQLENAEALYKRALAIQEKTLGPYRTEVEETRHQLDRLAHVRKQSDSQSNSHHDLRFERMDHKFATDSSTYLDAVPAMALGWTQSLADDQEKDLLIEIATVRHAMGKDHPHLADCLTKFADVLCRRKRYSQMEPVLKEALSIRVKALGEEHPLVSTSLKNLARLYYFQGQFALSEPLFRRALNIRQKIYGRSHPRYADVEEQYAKLLRKTDRVPLAQEMENHVKQVRAQFAL